MSKTAALEKKIRAVEEEFAADIEQTRIENFSQKEKERAAVAIGVIGAFQKISSILSAESMRALMQFQEQKMHEAMGFDRFENFLNDSPYSPMTKNQFYDRKKLLESEGDTLYDLLNGVGIPVSTRKLIGQNGDTPITIDGNELLIGEERADLSDLPLIKELIKKLSSANENFSENKKSQEAKIEKLEQQIKTGQSEYDELRRAMDAANEGDPHDKALMKLIGAFVKFNEQIRDLTVIEKTQRAEQVLNTLWVQVCITRRNYHRDQFIFEDVMNPQTNAISDLAKQALADSDDWGDEDEE